MAARKARKRRPKREARVALRPLDAFTRAFFEAALWSTSANATDDENDDRSFSDLGYTINDLDPYARNALARECESFEEEFGDAIDNADVGRWQQSQFSNRKEAGYDLWMTRSGHGVGFRDGDWPEPLAELLTDAAERLSAVDLYVVGQHRDARGNPHGGTIYASGYERPRRD